MSHSILLFYSIVLVLLIVLSGFFSCAETGLMSINRYRLRHKARMKKGSAVLILKLLKRPDRLLGMVLIGNNVANIFASALATVVAIHVFGNKAVVVVTAILTLLILIFAEVVPKTLAALYPERISGLVAWPVFILLKLFYPLVWLINAISNGLLKLFRVEVDGHGVEPLSREELRSVVYEATGKVPYQYQSMLLGILDLNKMTVEDVMIPYHQIIGINLEQEWNVVYEQIMQSPHAWLPVYRENINKIVGMLQVRELMPVVSTGLLNEELLLKALHEPYFIPMGTLLNIQLHHFQQQNKHLALVVDEYGEIQGLLTLKDILEEIVGDFTTKISEVNKMILLQSDGSYLIDGAVTVRDLNRITHWQFPIKGPRTMNGLIVEYLEAIPRVGTSVLIADYPIEIIDVQDNRVKTARVFPPIHRSSAI